MEPRLHKPAERLRSTVAGRVEGYLALALTALLLFVPGFYPTTNLVIAIIGITSGLALGGVRFAKGGGHVAAWLALVVLSLWLLALVVRSILHWEEVRWYWRLRS